MEHKYYLIIDGQQVGPLGFNELIAAGLTPDTPVWRAGLENWVKASSLPELTAFLQPAQPYQAYQQPTDAYQQPGQPYQQAGQPYQQPYQQPFQQPYGSPTGFNQPPYNGLPVSHTNWMPWAIVGTVLGFICCFIGMVFGILGIVYANKANRFYNDGNAMMGDQANSSARTNTIISLVLCGLGIPASLYILSGSMAEILAGL